MAQLAPPQPPQPPQTYLVTFDEPLRRVHFRLWQILASAFTVILTCWFASFGLVPAIVAIMVAKHVLVAILAAGLRLPMAPVRLDGNRTM